LLQEAVNLDPGMFKRGSMNEQQTDEENNTTKVRRLLAFLGMLLVAVGQVFLNTIPVNESQFLPPYWWIGVIGLLFFIYALIYRPVPFVQKMAARLHVQGTTSWVVGAASFSGLCVITMLLFQKYDRTNYIPVVTFWLSAGACYVVAFWGRGFSRAEVVDWLKSHRYEILAIGLVTLLGLVLRFYRLGEVPRVVNGDEGRLGLAALSTNKHPLASPFALWENFGAFYLHLVNLFLYWFGQTSFALRLLPAIGGTLAIPALYLLARQIAGHRIALISSCLLAISHTHLHFSRTAAVGYIQGTWLAPLELYLLLSGLEKRSPWRPAQVMVGLIFAYMLIALIFFRSWFKHSLRPALVFWGGFIVTFLPESFYIMQKPGEFFNRLNQDGTFQSSWLPQQMAETGQSVVQILAERVIHAFLTLIYYPSIDFYGSYVPMLSLVSATLFLLGLGAILLRVRDHGFLLLNGYFWAGTLAVGIFALPPTADSYRMLIVLPPAVLTAAIGLDKLLELLGLGWERSKNGYHIIIGALLFSLLVFNLSTYYVDFAGRCLYGGDPMTRFASYLGVYGRTLKSEANVYLLSDNIYRYGTHPSVDFLSQGRLFINFDEPIENLDAISGETIVATPDRAEELKRWVRLHPGGDIQEQFDCQNLILAAYKIP
jgi:hypothetical protein